jgi:hypothetical protein
MRVAFILIILMCLATLLCLVMGFAGNKPRWYKYAYRLASISLVLTGLLIIFLFVTRL